MIKVLEMPYINFGAQQTIAAIDNGATRTRINVFEGNELIDSSVYSTPPDYDEAMHKIGTTILEATNLQPVDAIGMAIAGQVSEGTIIQAGVLKANGWCNKPISAQLSQFTRNKSVEDVELAGDVAAAAKSEMEEVRKVGGPDKNSIFTISTGLGGADFDVSRSEIFDDEPGHAKHRPGATCGCGENGCIEAYVSGSGIERRFGSKGEDLPDENWQIVMDDLVVGYWRLLHRSAERGFVPAQLHFFGSVALKGRGAPIDSNAHVPKHLQEYGVLAGLHVGLEGLAEAGSLPFLPNIRVATNGDNSGIMGAAYLARELLAR